ncbi:MAG: hypothetical protein AAGC93_18210 [Cyanobacteria bacterium P01_F01_bin.53]
MDPQQPYRADQQIANPPQNGHDAYGCGPPPADTAPEDDALTTG